MTGETVKRIRCIALALVCCLLGAAPVYGAGLGDIEVKSRLYEPFHARIALRGVSEGELEGLRVSLASEATFERAGLQRSLFLFTLRFEVVATGAGGGYLRVTSHDRVREPSLSFVIEAALADAAGILQRRYDVLLDLN